MILSLSWLQLNKTRLLRKINFSKNKFVSCFVIHEHHATHLHYDLRLEIGGKLVSWVLPKLPDIQEGEKRLAIQVEDHPLSYKDYEGKIPKGSYGAGVVKIWDTGQFIPILKKENENSEEQEITNEKAIEEIQNGVLHFILNGKKIKGKFILIRINNVKKNWLLLKKSYGLKKRRMYKRKKIKGD